jgi:hypothetical protein
MPAQPYRDGVATAMFALLFGGLALAWVWSAGFIIRDDPYGEPAPEIFAIANATLGSNAWFAAIDSFYLEDHTLQVATNLSHSGDFTLAAGRAIYDQLWFLAMQHPEWRIGSVFIFDRSDDVLCGGAA